MRYFITILFFLFALGSTAQDKQARDFIIAGNEFYKQQQYDQAVAEYQKALVAEPLNMTARFNYSNALYKAGKQVEASKSLTELSGMATEKGLRSKSYYNKGVILSAQKNLEESIEAYKNALRQDHEDVQARENLQKALLELKKKEPPKPKEQDKKQNKNEQKQKQSQPKMNPREAEQRLKLLEQKEKEVQQRLQKEKVKMGGGQGKDW